MAHYKFHNDCQLSVLTYEQVKRLDFVMDQTVPIHGRGNYPTLYVKLKELIRLVKHKLQKEHSIEIRDVRLFGGAASYVLAPENSHYNDLDLIFGTDLSNEDHFDVIRDVVLECLKEFYPKEVDNSTATKSSSETEPTRRNRTTSCDSDNLIIQIESDDNEEEEEGGEEDEEGNQGRAAATESKSLASTREATSGSIAEGVDLKSECKGVVKQCATSEQSKDEQDSIDRSNKMSESPCQQNGLTTFISQVSQNQYPNYQMPLSNCAIKEAYVHKMVKVNDDDRWSLISLGVQQSEANCCSNINCLQSSFKQADHCAQENQNHHDYEQQQPQASFAITMNKDNDPQGLINQSRAQLISNENPANCAQIHQSTYLNHQHLNQRIHYQQPKKQFPNSIELKFVDRMRRKFEFSVDSFQIILDSLIQFYDYAPQSTITSQESLLISHPSSTMINTRPLISAKRCSGCGSKATAVATNLKTLDNSSNLTKTNAYRENHLNQQSQNHRLMNGFSGTKSCVSLLNSSRSYFQLPIEPANSPSVSSVASSSGCSSSSSLSCDEDHEDLYRDADSPSSSSASTSSLLSSTTLSLLSSSDGLCSAAKLANQYKSSANRANGEHNHHQHHHHHNNNHHHHHHQAKLASKKPSQNLNNKDSSRIGSEKEFSQISRPISAASYKTSASPDKDNFVLSDCVECFGQQQNLISQHVYNFETKNSTSCAVISENFYPTVIGRSEYGNFKEALYHLEKKLIATRTPEEIRGGGLLKYCNLLVKNYKPVNVYQIRTLERYMCSRFFIDFSDLNQQQAKLESYLANHFSDDPVLKFDYLTILHNVVQRSTVCLMNHELRLTLNMIRGLAYKLNEQQEQQQLAHLPNQPLATQQHLQQVQQTSLTQTQQQHYYQQQKPVSIQSGVYRVKLVNYTLAETVGVQ